MLVEFSVGNFWSFKDIQTLQLQAAKIVSKFPEVDRENTIAVSSQLSLLKTKAVFGANASGKTNLVRAMIAFLSIIKECLSDLETLQKNIIPFMLDDSNYNEPCFFQIVFIVDKNMYRYGFEATREMIVSEWLYGKEINKEDHVKERYYFKREGMQIQVNASVFKEGQQFVIGKKGIAPLYRKNSLLLSVIAAWNGSLTKKLVESLQNNFIVLSGKNDQIGMTLGLDSMSNADFYQKVTNLLRAIDPTISKIERYEVEQNSPFETKEDQPKLWEIRNSGKHPSFITVYRKTTTGAEIFFEMNSQEAEGTKRIFSLSHFIFSTLENGKVLVIDEFDARMHPRLTRKIVEMFHSLNTNPNNAQLIFTTHDTNLLDAKLLRRDQISFVKKNKDGASELYSLVEFKGVRNDASFEKDYLLGKYDAVPTNLNALDDLFQS